jgi:hypothetical protein
MPKRMKSPALSVAFVMYSASALCSLLKVLAAAFTIAIRWKGSLEFAAMTVLTSQGAARRRQILGKSLVLFRLVL